MGSWWFKKTDMVAEPNPTSPYLTIGVDTADSKLKSKTSAGVLTSYLDTVSGVVSARLINTTAPLTGGGDLSADRTFALTTSPAGQTPVGVTRQVATTAPLAGGGALSSDLTLSIGAATSSLSGSMSAADKLKLNNIWIDVTNNGVLTTNTGAQNTTALNNLIGASGTAPNGSTIFFPAGVFQFNGPITVGPFSYIFQGVGYNRAGSPATAYTELQMITSTSGFLTLTASHWYTKFYNLTFTAATNQTSGAAVLVGNNVGVDFHQCSFQGNGGTWFNVIDFTGAQGANSTVIDDCNIQGFTNFGVTVNGNGSSLVIISSVIQGQWGTATQTAAACVNCLQVGALQITASDIIGGTNNLLIAPTTGLVAASIYVVNTYFDNSFGSCIKITGAGATVRCKFAECSITTSNATTALTAVEISTTVAAGAQGIEFFNCSIQNTFSTTGTTNGFNITGGADVSIIGCSIAGWTNGINATPLTPAGTTKLKILGNTIGSSGGIVANATGILLNAGTVAYGQVQIQDNILQGNTTAALTDNSTVGPATPGNTSTGIKQIVTNLGGIITAPPPTFTATALPLTTITSVDPRGGVLIPSLIRPCAIRVWVYATNTASISTISVTVRYGTTNTNADAALLTQALTAGTAVVGSGTFIIDVDIATTTTAFVAFRFYNGNNAATGIAGNISLFASLSAAATISTAANNWLGVYFAETGVAATTIRAVRYEVFQ